MALATSRAGFLLFLTATVDSFSTVVEGPKHEGPPCLRRKAHHEPTLVEILVRRARQAGGKLAPFGYPEHHAYTAISTPSRSGSRPFKIIQSPFSVPGSMVKP